MREPWTGFDWPTQDVGPLSDEEKQLIHAFRSEALIVLRCVTGPGVRWAQSKETGRTMFVVDPDTVHLALSEEQEAQG